MDTALLIVGGFRASAFAIGVAVAYGRRSILGVVGFTLATCTAIVFALYNSDVHVPHWLVKLASYMSTPTAMLIVAAFLFHTCRHPRHRWDW